MYARKPRAFGIATALSTSIHASIGCSIIASILSLAGPASAQSDSAAARALFSEGRQLMTAEKYSEACPKFEESLRLDPGMGTQFNLAHCWEKIGRTASAWALFLDVAAAARAGNQPQREAAAKERAAALEPKLTRLRIEVPEPAPDAKIFRDDQEVGKAAWGTAMPVDPGDHVIRVTAEGKKEWTQDVKVPPTSRTFSVTVPALEDLAVAQASPPPDRHEIASDTSSPHDNGSSGGGGSSKVPALVIGGIGIAGLAVGTVFAVQGYSDNQQALKLCHVGDSGNDCPNKPEHDKHDQLVDDAKRELLIGWVAIGVGGAAVVTSAVMLLTGGESSDSAAFDVAPLWLAGGAGATVSGRF
jgi:hypothetical protein